MNIQSFLGSEACKARLAAQLAADRLPQSLLICAEAGAGSGYFARLLAADLLQTDPEAADGAARAHRVLQGSDPDCIEVEGEGASGLIKVERIRDVRREARETSLSGGRRVVILYNAYDLAASPANALLKILEEPPDGVWFLLTAPSAAAVLPTVRSRCMQLELLPPTCEECAAELCHRGVAAASARRLAQVWQGRVGAALACTQKGAAALFEAAEALCQATARRDAYALMKLLVPYEKKRPELQTLLADAAQILRADMLAPPAASAPPAADAARRAAAAQNIGALLQAAERLRANGNAKLLLTDLCLQLGA